MHKLIAYYREIPKMVKLFILRVLIVTVMWKLAYHLYFKPHRTLDKPLTTITAHITTQILKKAHTSDTNFATNPILPSNSFLHFSHEITLNGKKVINISDPCNALELMILYLGFLFCIPTNSKRLLVFSIFGLIMIFTANITRCVAMASLALYKKHYFDFAHHYLFTLIVYALIFSLWFFYSKGINKNE